MAYSTQAAAAAAAAALAQQALTAVVTIAASGAALTLTAPAIGNAAYDVTLTAPCTLKARFGSQGAGSRLRFG